MNRRFVGKFRVSRHFVTSYARGDASFRTISIVQSIQQHSAPNSKSRFRSRILLLSQFQGKSTNKLGLCCDTIGIPATTTQKISTLESSGKRKFTPGQIATAYVCCPGSQGPCKGVELYKSSPSHLTVGVRYREVAVRTILVQPCTYAKVDLRL